MRHTFLLLTLTAAVQLGCTTRKVEDETASVAPEPSITASGEDVPEIYSVNEFDAERDPHADLASTITQAMADHKRIILEVGGDW